MKLFGVTGNPILHSLSPALFAAAYNGRYKYIHILADEPSEVLHLLSALDLRGINITAPFKNLDNWGVGEVSREVRELGFMNTLKRNSDGNLSFHNTDIEGVIFKIERGRYKRALVLGAGGAGFTAAYALRSIGIETIIANRTVREDFVSLQEAQAVASEVDIILNTLHVRVLDNIDNQLFIDAIYHNSPYMSESEKPNYIGGINWLIGQAIPAYRRFTGEEPDINSMYNFVEVGKSARYNFIGKRAELFKDIADNDGKMIWLYEDETDLSPLKNCEAVIYASKYSNSELIDKIMREL